MLQRYQGSFNTFLGPTKILISSDTLQVKDYSRYNWTMFDPAHKKQRHETVFPEDQKKAFALAQLYVANEEKFRFFKAENVTEVPGYVYIGSCTI